MSSVSLDFGSRVNERCRSCCLQVKVLPRILFSGFFYIPWGNRFSWNPYWFPNINHQWKRKIFRHNRNGVKGAKVPLASDSVVNNSILVECVIKSFLSTHWAYVTRTKTEKRERWRLVTRLYSLSDGIPFSTGWLSPGSLLRKRILRRLCLGLYLVLLLLIFSVLASVSSERCWLSLEKQCFYFVLINLGEALNGGD